ncbi:MAG: glutamine--fructose-6-phosphate transaminase (isomerizing), partial [Kangiellaceae bacterium]|nr:glutamine--fructose-6-phosphate transaminase (isomerizing) [Kangiellaceae bacterium]
MCGIVGAVAQRDVAEILLMGLQRLEYRGYDSAGLAVADGEQLHRLRRLGKVEELASALEHQPVSGGTGIAHTRWATHGAPSEANAHPHVSHDRFAVVHNGIIENHQALRERLEQSGYTFSSETDTEVIVHLIHQHVQGGESLFVAVRQVVPLLEGAYGMVVLDKTCPDELIVARSGSPLVVGKGVGEHFIASDQLALLPVTRQFLFLEEGDVARVTRRDVNIVDSDGHEVVREWSESDVVHDAGELAGYRHFMQKEIFEQPKAIMDTIAGRVDQQSVHLNSLGEEALAVLRQVEFVQIVACGTSYHAGLVARYWLEGLAGIRCNVEIASEYRYRRSVASKNGLLITISQSGETADTLAALRLAKEQGFLSTLTICNVPGSSLV